MTCLSEYRPQDEAQQSRQSPSPTHIQAARSSTAAYAHKRRDSDTLRSFVPSGSTGLSSPTVVESHRVSPPGSRLQVRYSPPTSSKGRASPPSSNDRLTPPVAVVKGRLSPVSASSLVRDVVRHRRSPTAPEHPILNGIMRDRGEKEEEHGYVSAGERAREREVEKDRERERKWQQVQQSQQQQQQQQQFAAPPPSSAPAIPQATGPAPLPPAQINRHIVVRHNDFSDMKNYFPHL